MIRTNIMTNGTWAEKTCIFVQNSVQNMLAYVGRFFDSLDDVKG